MNESKENAIYEAFISAGSFLRTNFKIFFTDIHVLICDITDVFTYISTRKGYNHVNIMRKKSWKQGTGQFTYYPFYLYTVRYLHTRFKQLYVLVSQRRSRKYRRIKWLQNMRPKGRPRQNWEFKKRRWCVHVFIPASRLDFWPNGPVGSRRSAKW